MYQAHLVDPLLCGGGGGGDGVVGSGLIVPLPDGVIDAINESRTSKAMPINWLSVIAELLKLSLIAVVLSPVRRGRRRGPLLAMNATG